MRRQTKKALRRVVAFNLSRIQAHCGFKDWAVLCEECNIKKNIIDWVLCRVATRIKKSEFSNSFVWVKMDEYRSTGMFVFQLEAKSTNEKITITLPGSVFLSAKSAKKIKDID